MAFWSVSTSLIGWEALALKPVFGRQDEIRAFVEGGLGFRLSVGAFMAWEDAEIVAGVAFHNWHPEAGTIEISAYSARRDWLNTERLRDIFAYPFEQLGARLCVARIAEGNARARRVWRALGAKEYIIPELRGEGEAECLYLLLRADWVSGKFK